MAYGQENVSELASTVARNCGRARGYDAVHRNGILRDDLGECRYESAPGWIWKFADALVVFSNILQNRLQNSVRRQGCIESKVFRFFYEIGQRGCHCSVLCLRSRLKNIAQGEVRLCERNPGIIVNCNWRAKRARGWDILPNPRGPRADPLHVYLGFRSQSLAPP
jgi:hypothetical protein